MRKKLLAQVFGRGEAGWYCRYGFTSRTDNKRGTCAAFLFAGAMVPGRLAVTVLCCKASGLLQPLQAPYLVCAFKQAWLWLDVHQLSTPATIGSGPDISFSKGGRLRPSLKFLVHACLGTRFAIRLSPSTATFALRNFSGEHACG